MKQENFLFVDLVSSIFLIALMLGNLMGLLYITDGNFVLSLFISLFIIVCYYFVIQMLKRNKEQMVNSSYLHTGTLFFLIFFIFGIASFFFMSHFLNIETNAKAKIKSEAYLKIEKVRNLSDTFKIRSELALQQFSGDLHNKLTTYKISKSNVLLNELSLPPYEMDAQVLGSGIYNVTDIVDAKMQPTKSKVAINQHHIDSILIPGSSRYQATFEKWKRMNLVVAYNNLDKYVADSYKFVNEKITELPLTNQPIRDITIGTQLPLHDPFKLNMIYKPNYWLPLLVVLITHLFILIPYFTYKVREYKKPEPNIIKTGYHEI